MTRCRVLIGHLGQVVVLRVHTNLHPRLGLSLADLEEQCVRIAKYWFAIGQNGQILGYHWLVGWIIEMYALTLRLYLFDLLHLLLLACEGPRSLLDLEMPPVAGQRHLLLQVSVEIILDLTLAKLLLKGGL